MSLIRIIRYFILKVVLNYYTIYLRSSDENYAASNVTDGKLNTMWDTGDVGDYLYDKKK